VSFAPQRVLVTGAVGFVGRHLMPALAAAFPAAELIGAARPGEAPPGMRPFDLLDPAGIEALVAGTRPEACIHLAALSAVGDSFAQPDAVWRANVDGSRALAAALLRHAPGCVLLHVSSGEVYGLSFRAGGGTPLDEGAAMRPANPYAAAKAAADIALGEMALRGLRVLRMRPLNHVGPGQTTRFAIPAFAAQIARIAAGLQEPVIRTGALDRRRDFLDVRDVCAAYVAALRAAEALAPGTALNLASGQLRRLGDVLAELMRLAGVEARVEETAAALRPVDLVETPLSAARAREALGWAPRIPWEETLRGILDASRQEV
jgi:GDP-4-dehydro-6-deoxy-D-mannose reductase